MSAIVSIDGVLFSSAFSHLPMLTALSLSSTFLGVRHAASPLKPAQQLECPHDFPKEQLVKKAGNSPLNLRSFCSISVEVGQALID